jgi:hypothetical protein
VGANVYWRSRIKKIVVYYEAIRRENTLYKGRAEGKYVTLKWGNSRLLIGQSRLFFLFYYTPSSTQTRHTVISMIKDENTPLARSLPMGDVVIESSAKTFESKPGKGSPVKPSLFKVRLQVFFTLDRTVACRF